VNNLKICRGKNTELEKLRGVNASRTSIWQKNRGNHKKQSYIKNMYLEWIMYE